LCARLLPRSAYPSKLSAWNTRATDKQSDRCALMSLLTTNFASGYSLINFTASCTDAFAWLDRYADIRPRFECDIDSRRIDVIDNDILGSDVVDDRKRFAPSASLFPRRGVWMTLG